jgi:hypothetical protein
MASVQDRWYAERKGADGQIVRIPTPRKGTGKRWRVRYRTPFGDDRSKSFARKADADRFAINAESSKMDGTFVDPVRAKITVGEMAVKWTASKSGLEKSTQSTYSNVMDDHVLPRWKKAPLAAVEFEDVQAWIAELIASGLSGAHIRKIHFVLAGVLQLAVKGKRLPANPAKGVDIPRAPSPRTRSTSTYSRSRLWPRLREKFLPMHLVAPHSPVGINTASPSTCSHTAVCGGLKSPRCASTPSTCYGGGCTSRLPSSRLTAKGWSGAHRRVTKHDGCRCQPSLSMR